MHVSTTPLTASIASHSAASWSRRWRVYLTHGVVFGVDLRTRAGRSALSMDCEMRWGWKAGFGVGLGTRAGQAALLWDAVGLESEYGETGNKDKRKIRG